MANGIHTEQTFEAVIEESLLSKGSYIKGHSDDFDTQKGLFPKYVTDFLKETQPKAWEKITATHKGETEQKVVARLMKEIDLRGILDVIRNGFTDYGVKFNMAYFKPESSLNPDAETLYNLNNYRSPASFFMSATAATRLIWCLHSMACP